MDGWVEQERRLAGPCPACGIRHAHPVVVGEPDSREVRRLEGLVIFAGCLVPPDAPRFVCGACDHRWGTPEGLV